ncbi:nitroreductase family protein [Microbacterium sp. SS28]|uniref:nitroreductase family protein n=1 Tax=Microbacterium sp. SS28 TaxID=2919948 RepID=UPI001FA9FBED|nr:nitroreductase family protein [Microbacterium sp. SS28]
MSLIATRTASTEAPILDVLAERWSTRIFDPAAVIDEGALASALEAARWAPSASNTQPTHYIVARRGGEAHAAIVVTLAGFNQAWAGDASVLIPVLAETADETGAPRPWALYDAGQAAAHFTVQAHAVGLYTHQLGGFDVEAVRAAFALDERFRPITIIAVGSLGDPAAASVAIVDRENAPRQRRPIADSVLLDA